MWNANPSPGFKFRPRKGVYTDGKNNVFNPDSCEATSYEWWTYVKRIKGKVVFNAYPYSHTTQNHQRNMRKLLKALKIKIDVEVSMKSSLESFWSGSLPHQYETLYKLEIQAKRARKPGVYVESHREHYKTHAAAIEGVKASIALCRSLGATFTRKQMAELKAEVIRRDESRLQAAREERAAVKAKREALKPSLTDLGEVSLKVFQDVSDLDSIEFNTQNEVSNA